MSPISGRRDGIVSLGPGAPVLAFDVGGTDIKAALFDGAGVLHEFKRVSTPQAGPDVADAVIEQIALISEELMARSPDTVPTGIGLLVPGQVDTVRGLAVQAENMGWQNAPLRDHLARKLSLPVAFGHDVTGAGEAERSLGAGTEFEDVIFVSIGTGISCAIYVHGELYIGSGMAGELGHIRVADEPSCRCGGVGCLEAIASAAALVRRYNDLSSLQIRGAKELVQRVARGDRFAVEVWERGLDSLALGLSYVVSLFAPEALIVGGGLASAGDAVFLPLNARLDSLLTFQARLHLTPAALGEKAGVMGAALKARELTQMKSR